MQSGFGVATQSEIGSVELKAMLFVLLVVLFLTMLAGPFETDAVSAAPLPSGGRAFMQFPDEVAGVANPYYTAAVRADQRVRRRCIEVTARADPGLSARFSIYDAPCVTGASTGACRTHVAARPAADALAAGVIVNRVYRFLPMYPRRRTSLSSSNWELAWSEERRLEALRTAP